jgi:hypothetical protein
MEGRLPLAAILLSLSICITGLARVGHAHEPARFSTPATAVTSDAEPEEADVLRALTQALGDAALSVDDRREIARVRQAWLAELMERNPSALLRQAMTSSARGALAPELQALVESEEDHEGEIDVFHSEGPQGGAYHYALRTATGQRLDLRVARGVLGVLTGTTVRVRGIRVQQALALGGSDAVTVLGVPPLPGTFGERRLLVVLVRFLDTLAASPSVSAVQTMMFGSGSTSVSTFFRENSYDQMSLTGTVVGPLLLPTLGGGCNTNLIASLAQTAISTLGIVLGQYQHVMYAFPNSGCGWWGYGTIGGSPGHTWVNGSLTPVVAVHELGHNLGLYHSHALECGASVMTGSCSSVDYGDQFDAMGSGNGPTHFNAVQKELLGWLDYGASPPITEVTESGMYTIDPYESPGTTPKALRIKTATNDWLYVEYRRPIGFDSYLSSNPSVMNGVIVHLFDNSPDKIYLLDTAPATTSWADAPLTIGSTLEDTVGRVSITPVSSNGTTMTVNVSVTGTPCTRAAPTVTLSPAQQEAPAGSTVTYALTVGNNGSGCGASSFTLAPAVPAGWTAAVTAPVLTLAEGATGSTTVQVTSPAAAGAGAHSWSVSTSEGAYATSAAATYTVPAPPGAGGGTPGAGGTGGFSDDFERPDATALDNGWSVAAGSVKIVSGEARNNIVKTLHVAVRPELSGPAQTAQATFASVNNNVAPRFGVVLRYAAPNRYYLCYRQVGGSSLLRIAKVINGVETVLKSASVPNPIVGTPFTLSCSVNGTALALSLDGVPKAATTDAALATGTVGFAMGGATGGGASHRATTFSANVQ